MKYIRGWTSVEAAVLLKISVIWNESIIIAKPSKYWIGINQDFLRPNLLKYIESTIGAQRSLRLNGQKAKENVACWDQVAPIDLIIKGMDPAIPSGIPCNK